MVPDKLDCDGTMLPLPESAQKLPEPHPPSQTHWIADDRKVPRKEVPNASPERRGSSTTCPEGSFRGHRHYRRVAARRSRRISGTPPTRIGSLEKIDRIPHKVDAADSNDPHRAHVNARLIPETMPGRANPPIEIVVAHPALEQLLPGRQHRSVVVTATSLVPPPPPCPLLVTIAVRGDSHSRIEAAGAPTVGARAAATQKVLRVDPRVPALSFQWMLRPPTYRTRHHRTATAACTLSPRCEAAERGKLRRRPRRWRRPTTTSS
jgi:hypothetical protein